MIQNFKRTFSFIHQHPITKKKILKAYYNLFYWQLQILLNKGFIIKPYIGNVKFFAKKSLTGITGNIYTGLHEFEDMGFLLHFLREEDTFFDIGANVGSYTLLASGYIGAKTIAFEPVPSTFEIFKKNISLNNLSSIVKAYNNALGKQKGIVKFTTKLDTVNHIITNHDKDEQTVDVEALTLDDFIEHSPLLLKIDVEGFETEVIKGGKQIIESETTKAIIIELNGSGKRYGYDEERIHNYLLDNGYLAYNYNPHKRTLININKFGSHNTIYIKDINYVEHRCRTAKKIQILGVNF